MKISLSIYIIYKSNDFINEFVRFKKDYLHKNSTRLRGTNARIRVISAFLYGLWYPSDMERIINESRGEPMINFANNLILDFEKYSDRRISAICRVLTVLIIVVILLNMLHVFKISIALYPTLIVSAVILLMPTLFYDILNLRSRFIRYLVRTLLIFMSALCIRFFSIM